MLRLLSIITIIFIFCGQLLFVTTAFNTINIYSNNNNSNNSNKLIRTVTMTMAMTMARTEDTETSSPSSSSLGKKRSLRSVQTMLVDNESSTRTAASSSASSAACIGDIVTLNIQLTPEDGFVPEHLFDSSGEITFVLGWGNYLPGLHELLLLNGSNSNSDNGSSDTNSGGGGGMIVDDEIKNVSIDAGFGRHNPDMVIEVPKTNLKKVKHIEKIQPNTTLNLQGGIQVNVLEVTKDTIIVDANHPLAGSSYLCSFKVLSIDKFPIHKLQEEEEEAAADVSQTKITTTSSTSSPYEIATFAAGCFWGLELAFMRTNGIVGTRAGYSQGIVSNPSYEEISEGSTKHREAVMVIYDSRIVSYKDILTIYNDRLVATAPEYFKLDIFAEDETDDEDNEDDNSTNAKRTTEDSLQYKHGIYFHNDQQKQQANEFILSSTSINNMNNRYHCDVELLPANIFYNAEGQHQQYLYKGGQAARKGCRDIIRCHG